MEIEQSAARSLVKEISARPRGVEDASAHGRRRTPARTHKNGLHTEAVFVPGTAGDQLPVSLLLRQSANEGQHKALAVESAHEHDHQYDKEGQIH